MFSVTGSGMRYQQATLSRGAVHGFRNSSASPVRFLNGHRPALAFQAHLETLDRLSRAGKITGLKDLRSLIYLSMSGIDHQVEVAMKPPRRVLRGLAFIGQRLGYQLNNVNNDAPRDRAA